MKYPFAVNRKIVTTSTFQYNEEGIQTSTIEVIQNKASFCECVQEECGAYKNGECHYKE